MPPSNSENRRTWLRYLLLAGALAIAIIEITHGIHKGEFNLNFDEPHHAFTGIFFADFLRDMPLAHPVRYAYLYYARYPVLGIVHWPPFFYLIEGIVYLALGPSVVTARLTVLFFVIFGLYFWFRLIRELAGEWAAAAATVVLACAPLLFLFEKAVMLEAPSLALSIAAIYFWMRFLRGGLSRHLYIFAVLAALALLTKQQSIFLVPFCILTILTERKWRIALEKRLWLAVGLVIVIAGPFYALDFMTAPRGIDEAVVLGNRVLAHPAVYYWTVLPKQIGLPLLVLAIFGGITWRWWGRDRDALFMLMWIVACYIAFTPIAIKEPRYILDWVPPFVYFAVAPLASNIGRRWLRAVAAAVLVALVVSEAWSAWRYQRPYVSGYAAVARQLVSEGKPSIVLYDAGMSADFCFFLRVDDPARRFVVMRKGLYAVDEAKAVAYVELVKTRPQLVDLIQQYGIRYIIVDNRPIQFPIQRTLRDLLKTPQFTLIRKFHIQTNVPMLSGRVISLYENNCARAPTAKYLDLRMLSLKHNIVVPLSSLLGK